MKALTAQQVIDELNFSAYILDPSESNNISANCKSVLQAQTEETYDQKAQIESNLEFIRALWRKYDCKEVAEIYNNFVRIEEALYGLERKEKTNEGYRDHFLHMFNCFVFGLRIISNLCQTLGDEKAKALFKVEDEKLSDWGLPFSRNYSYKERLFYLWTLISTFHDIAVPLQHLTKIGSGVNEFVQEFGWVLNEPTITTTSFDASQLYKYLENLSYIYSGKLEIKNAQYEKGSGHNAYLIKILGREFDRRNHGVLSGFFLYKTIEEIFLFDKSGKHKLKIDEFNKYVSYVLNQDISRAALAISMHALPPTRWNGDIKYPKLFPLAFETFPLTFLLILSDELQEYLRWEGTTFRRNMKFNYLPRLELKTNNEEHIELNVHFL